MDFFKIKEKEGQMKTKELPELPGSAHEASPGLPELPPLPSLPRTSAGEAMSLGAIKSSVREYPKTGPRAIEVPEGGMIAPLSAGPRAPAVKEPVFVRIDKFKDAVRKFEDVKKKVDEIENALKKIREIKDEEEEELKTWEADVQAIKEKVRSVEESLFTKL